MQLIEEIHNFAVKISQFAPLDKWSWQRNIVLTCEKQKRDEYQANANDKGIVYNKDLTKRTLTACVHILRLSQLCQLVRQQMVWPYNRQQITPPIIIER